MTNFSIFTWFFAAHFIAQTIVVCLIILSVISWSLILYKFAEFKKINRLNQNIHIQIKSQQWSLHTLYQSIRHLPEHLAHGLMVKSAFEVLRHPNLSSKMQSQAFEMMLDNSIEQTELKCEQHLGHLSSIAAISPYIGLLGTVWGIMHTFLQLGAQANIEKIMPSIAESLIVTGLGLFVAIPAAWSYNFFQDKIDRLVSQLYIFKKNIIFQALQVKSNLHENNKAENNKPENININIENNKIDNNSENNKIKKIIKI